MVEIDLFRGNFKEAIDQNVKSIVDKCWLKIK